MQADELKGRGVLPLSNAEKIGQVEDVLFDAEFRQVRGLTLIENWRDRRSAKLPMVASGLQ